MTKSTPYVERSRQIRQERGQHRFEVYVTDHERSVVKALLKAMRETPKTRLPTRS